MLFFGGFRQQLRKERDARTERLRRYAVINRRQDTFDSIYQRNVFIWNFARIGCFFGIFLLFFLIGKRNFFHGNEDSTADLDDAKLTKIQISETIDHVNRNKTSQDAIKFTVGTINTWNYQKDWKKRFAKIASVVNLYSQFVKF